MDTEELGKYLTNMAQDGRIGLNGKRHLRCAADTISRQSETIKALTEALESALYWANMANGAYVIGQSARDSDLSAAYDVLQKAKEE